MEIKDIAVSAERLDDVRGGQVDVSNVGLQLSANSVFGGAYSAGVGNSASQASQVIAPQDMVTTNNIHATKLQSFESVIANSVVGFPFAVPVM